MDLEKTTLDGPLLRALGPASVSSLLKVVLNVVFYVIWAIEGFLVIALLIMILFPFLVTNWIEQSAISETLRTRHLPVAVLIAVAMAYLGGILVIVGRLRRVFDTLSAGDPFDPANVGRLRIIGLCLACLELGRYAIQALASIALQDWAKIRDSVSLTAWFSVMVVLVLAEVFREGARLRREAELTI